MRTTRRGPALFTAVALSLSLAAPLPSQESGVTLRLSLPDRVRVSERSNVSVRDDGRYVGLASTQVTGYLTRIQPPDLPVAEDYDFGASAGYSGRFFRFQKTRRDMAEVARRVEESIDSVAVIAERTLFSAYGVYPSYRSIPVLPHTPVVPGATWEAEATVVINPRQESAPLSLPVTVAYQYVGSGVLAGEPVHLIQAGFATRYPLPPKDGEAGPTPIDYAGEMTQVRGSHSVSIAIPAGSGAPVFIRDELAESYHFADGSQTEIQGHRLFFVYGLSLDEQSRLRETLEEAIDSSAVADVTVDTTNTGVRLTVRELRFLPDQPALLPDEAGRLDELAAALRRMEGVRFLIVGHTADVGSQASQLSLSWDRARAIAGELSARGIDPNRVDIDGRGGSEPVGDNDTEAGRALNRRVEIYVLEE